MVIDIASNVNPGTPDSRIILVDDFCWLFLVVFLEDIVDFSEIVHQLMGGEKSILIPLGSAGFNHPL